MLSKRTIWGVLCSLLLLAAFPGLALADDGGDRAGYEGAVTVTLADGAVLADGEPVPEGDGSAAVYTAHDIVYYEAGRDFTYGEGTEQDAHTAEEAAAHTVVHIAQPGVYVLQGVLEQGQIAVDLGKNTDEDPDAAVTLVLDGVDVTCTVAPAVIFYNVYECDPEGASGIEPDLSGAGARVVIADGSENNIAGSYVARIYKSYTLNEDGTAVTDSKKLHKYDGAFYSKMSMLVTGGPECSGVLNITAENEGLDTEMHLTIDGGNIHIVSGNDGINVNEDDVSVATINGGSLSITVTGETGEGDGIDSNGALVINSGTVIAQACSRSGDSGLDAATGVYLNGGMVIATGNMLDPITPSDQCCAVFTFPQTQTAGTRYSLADPDGKEIMGFVPENDFSILVMTCPALTEGETYSLCADGAPIPVSAENSAPGKGGPAFFGRGPAVPEGQAQPPELPEGMNPEEAGGPPELPEGRDPLLAPDQAPEPDRSERPDPLLDPAGGPPQDTDPDRTAETPQNADADSSFTLSPGLNYFSA